MNGGKSLLAQQAYVKVVRKMTMTGQQTVEEERVITLYEDKITTRHREFPIADVLDISYRAVGRSGGMLYLHTRSGVFSYVVKTPVADFIDHFKAVRKIN